MITKSKLDAIDKFLLDGEVSSAFKRFSKDADFRSAMRVKAQDLALGYLTSVVTDEDEEVAIRVTAAKEILSNFDPYEPFPASDKPAKVKPDAVDATDETFEVPAGEEPEDTEEEIKE